MDVAAIAPRIRDLATRGVSLREIARSSGVGRTSVTGIANGSVRQVHPATFAQLASYLDSR